MSTPPMLRPRTVRHTDARQPDPLVAIAVFGLSLVAAALFVAAILAVYTYSTPDVELPLVVAIALAFVALAFAFIVGHAVRRLRLGRYR